MQLNPDDLHNFFVIRLIDILEVRAAKARHDVEVALTGVHTAELNIVSERAFYDSLRALKNASLIADTLLSNIRIAKTLIKK